MRQPLRVGHTPNFRFIFFGRIAVYRKYTGWYGVKLIKDFP